MSYWSFESLRPQLRVFGHIPEDQHLAILNQSSLPFKRIVDDEVPTEPQLEIKPGFHSAFAVISLYDPLYFTSLGSNLLIIIFDLQIVSQRLAHPTPSMRHARAESTPFIRDDLAPGLRWIRLGSLSW